MSTPANGPSATAIETDPAARNTAMVCHLTGLTSLLGGLHFAGIWVPLIIWLLKKDSHPFVSRSGAEALNFQISYHLYMLISGALVFVLIGFVLLPIVFLAWLVLTIVGTVKASSGSEFRYPLTIRLIQG